MHEFEAYLEQLRTGLPVGPRRAAEICQEVQSHLEARLLQYESSGLSHDEAVAKAIASFGDPKEVVPMLLRANAQHHRAQALRSLGLGLLLGPPLWYLVGLAWLMARGTPLAQALTYSWPEALLTGAIFGGLAGVAIGQWRARLRWFLAVVLAVPVALLALWFSLRLGFGAETAMTTVRDAAPGLRDALVASVGLAVTFVVLAWAIHRFVLRPAKPLVPSQ